MSFDTPVLLIAWRRPQTTQKVLDAIRAIAPTRMFVACDGPNRDRLGEVEKVAATRALIADAIDWTCEIQTLYSDTNQGCRLGVSSAITWFFEHVEEGIILEDDCVPHPDFFPYCAELLEKYRDHSSIVQISGYCHNKLEMRDSYYFSIYSYIWGWATWKRAWKYYDNSMSLYPNFKESLVIQEIVSSEQKKIFVSLFEAAYNQNHEWPHAWLFAIWLNHGLCVVPKENLIANIGYELDATTPKNNCHYSTQQTSPILPLKHPVGIYHNRSLDGLTNLDKTRTSVISILKLQLMKNFLLFAKKYLRK